MCSIGPKISRWVKWPRGVPIGKIGFNLCSAHYSECADPVYFTLSPFVSVVSCDARCAHLQL